MKIDTIVMRHGCAGAPHFLTRCVDASVINAGDGAHEHPTQALLDAFTIREKVGAIKGLKVSIIGDIAHSRVARSNIWALTKLGAQVTVCGPKTLMPVEIEKMGVKVDLFFTMGIPGEKYPDLAETVSLRRKIKRRFKNIGRILTTTIPLEPASPWYLHSETFGIVSTRKSFTDF